MCVHTCESVRVCTHVSEMVCMYEQTHEGEMVCMCVNTYVGEVVCMNNHEGSSLTVLSHLPCPAEPSFLLGRFPTPTLTLPLPTAPQAALNGRDSLPRGPASSDRRLGRARCLLTAL